MFLTIPYDESWTATIDGVAAEIKPIDDAFMAIEMSSGTHTVELTYHPTKFKLCVLISIASLIALVLFTLTRKLFEHIDYRKSLEEAEAAAEDSETVSEDDVPDCAEEDGNSSSEEEKHDEIVSPQEPENSENVSPAESEEA